MDRKLTQHEIDYVLHHLAFHVNGFPNIQPFIRTDGQPSTIPAILMPLSDLPPSVKSIFWIEEGVPLLFPLSETPEIWSFTEEGHLVFHHDLLKSAFYLLSSRGEWEKADKQDQYRRFDFNHSIQKQLNITDKPVVNYYFNLIIEGLKVFAQRQGITLEYRRPFGETSLMITHDVDRVDYYSWRSTAFRWLQWAGIKPREADAKPHLKMALDALRKMTLPRSRREDPRWSFEFFRQTERTHGFSSTWFFLNRDGSPHDAPYRFEEKRIKEVANQLIKEGCEVGLHGSFKASESPEGLKDAVFNFKKHFKLEPIGIRQHFLRGVVPQIYQMEMEVGLKYDAGFGFAAHEGFRNSYCWPFKPFDHDRQEMIPFYVIPMVWMDTTLFEHRRTSLEESLQISYRLHTEIVRFNGLFNLLWHSCRTNEWLQPGIHNLYRQWCQFMAEKGAKTISGIDALASLEDESG